MTCRWPRASVMTALAVALSLSAMGCGGDESGDEAAKAATKHAQEAIRLVRRGQLEDAELEAAKARRAAEMTKDEPARREVARAQAVIDAQRERDFEKDFPKPTGFEKVVDALPIRKPPLYVEQYGTFEDSHRLETAVDRKRFFCGKTPDQRQAAVAAFYRSADRRFRASGIRDFVQVVTLPGKTGTGPTLAVARQGSVSLTRLGRGRGRC